MKMMGMEDSELASAIQPESQSWCSEITWGPSPALLQHQWEGYGECLVSASARLIFLTDEWIYRPKLLPLWLLLQRENSPMFLN